MLHPLRSVFFGDMIPTRTGIQFYPLSTSVRYSCGVIPVRFLKNRVINCCVTDPLKEPTSATFSPDSHFFIIL